LLPGNNGDAVAGRRDHPAPPASKSSVTGFRHCYRTADMISKAAAALAILFAATACARARTIQIVAFGDSATAGHLVARHESYPAQLQAALRAKGYDAVVRNEGMSGDTTADALRRFDTAIGPGTDVAIVEFGTNDLRRHVPVHTVQSHLLDIVDTLRARHIEVMLVGLGRLDLSAVARSKNILYAQWKLPPGKYRARDGAHFNAEGYAIVVRQMLPTIETLIARAKARR
jgi:acyl-CoA thioesterase-1